jgi:hypothetical protein
MRVHDRFPDYAHKGCDFVSGSNKLKKGEKVLDLMVDVEDLGMAGTLCVTESTVKTMMKRLKIDCVGDAELAELYDSLEQLAQENDELKDKLERVAGAVAA